MFCTKCGSACPPEYKFCNHCGHPLARPGSPEATAMLQAPFVPVPQAVPSAVVPGMPAGAIPAAGQPLYYTSPQAAVHPHNVQQINLLHSLRTRIQHLASTEELEGFSLKEMFSEVFRRRGAQEIEDYILVGSTKTTPAIDVVQTGWPKPWLFFRVLVTLVVAYAVCTFTLMHLSDAGNMIPAVMILGAFAVPLATLTFFFEMNSPRNVSVHAIAKLFLLGAVVSLVFALVGYTMPVLGSMGNMAAGIVEEVAKLLTVVIVVRGVRYKYILNGLLFGATVGAGFAAFETSGYALNHGLLAGNSLGSGVALMLDVLRTRAFLTPWGHVAWTAIAAGAFWRVKGDKPVRISMLFDSRFLKAFMIPVVLHTLWDAPWQLPFDGNYIISALVSWYVVFGLVQQGLHQVKDEQRVHLQTTLEKVEASLQPPGTVAV